jgi:protocatechuate 4,5-dioxygenase alpha chain
MTENEDGRRDWDGIEGTYVFDGRRSRQGYPLNDMCMSLNEPENREEFRRDSEAYMVRYGLSEEQMDAVRRRDWIAMLEHGGNIYFLGKLASLDGLNMQQLGALQSGVTTEEFVEMMRSGGRRRNG